MYCFAKLAVVIEKSIKTSKRMRSGRSDSTGMYKKIMAFSSEENRPTC